MDDEVGRGPLGSPWGEGEPMPDTELVRWAAAGDRSAFEELYRRHSESAWRVAMAVTGRADDAADAVAESFARLLASFEDGRLRDLQNFRAYLLSTTRNASIDVVRRSARLGHGDDSSAERSEDSPSGPADDLMAMVDRSLVAAAFRSLPERWRSVLWLTEVEGLAPAEAGPLLGVSANGAAQLAVRARAGLRERFLQAHLRGDVEEGCRFTVERLGAYVAGGLAARDIAKLDQHLTACPACAARRDELADLGPTLRSAVVAAPAGLGAAAWAHWQRGGSIAPAGRTAVGMSGPQRALFGASVGLLGVGIIAATIVGQTPFGSDRFGSAAAAPFGEDPAVATSRPAALLAAGVAPLSLDLTGAGGVGAPGAGGGGAGGPGASTGAPTPQTPTGGGSGGLIPPPLTGVGATSTPTSTPTLQVTATLPSVSPSAPNTGTVSVGGSGSPLTVGTSPSSGVTATVGGSATGGSTTVSAGTGGLSVGSGGSTTTVTTPTTLAAPTTGTGTVTGGATSTLGTVTSGATSTLSGATGTSLP